ncbi:MAG: hypothetical protein ACLQVD_16405 [Capsulimonadaceae bacterium]
MVAARYLSETELSPEEALGEMRRNVSVHVTTQVLQRLIGTDSRDMGNLTQAVIPHLVSCAHCRRVLRQACDSVEAREEHPARLLLTDADELVRWQAAATTASEAAQKALLDQGIGYVYEREGIVYRRMPDGTDEQVTTP